MPLKKRISSFLLLSVLLPMVLVAPFHHHSESAPEDIRCESCSEHQPHSGHLTAKTSTDECLICRILCQQYAPSDALVAGLPSSEMNADPALPSEDIPVCFTHHSSPRAPPVSFCI